MAEIRCALILMSLAACSMNSEKPRPIGDAASADAGNSEDRVAQVLSGELEPNKRTPVRANSDGTVEAERRFSPLGEPLSLASHSREEEERLRAALGIAERKQPEAEELRRQIRAEKSISSRAYLQTQLAALLPPQSEEALALRRESENALRGLIRKEKRAGASARLRLMLANSLPDESAERWTLYREIAVLRWDRIADDGINPTIPARFMLRERGEWKGSLFHGELQRQP